MDRTMEPKTVTMKANTSTLTSLRVPGSVSRLVDGELLAEKATSF